MNDGITLTLQNLPRLILLHAHLPHIIFAKVAMRRVTDLHAATAGEELIQSTQSVTVQRGQKFSGGVPVEVWQTKRVGCHVPSRSEPEEVGQRSIRVSRLGCQDTVHGWIGVIDRCGILRGEFGEVVL